MPMDTRMTMSRRGLLAAMAGIAGAAVARTFSRADHVLATGSDGEVVAGGAHHEDVRSSTTPRRTADSKALPCCDAHRRWRPSITGTAAVETRGTSVTSRYHPRANQVLSTSSRSGVTSLPPGWPRSARAASTQCDPSHLP